MLSTECRSLSYSNEDRVNAFHPFVSFNPNSGEMRFPKDWPFNDETLNYITIFLGTVILLVVTVLVCCICYIMCCRSQYDETLVVTPSELIAIGANPSDLKAANITPSALEDSGATSQQMRELGFTQEVPKKEKSSEVKVRLKE